MRFSLSALRRPLSASIRRNVELPRHVRGFPSPTDWRGEVLYFLLVTRYDGRSSRALMSPLSCRTTCVVLRMSPSLSPTPMVDAIARNRALNSR